MLYLTVNRQKCRLRLTIKKFQSVSNLTNLANRSSRNSAVPKAILTRKNSSHAQKHSF